MGGNHENPKETHGENMGKLESHAVTRARGGAAVMRLLYITHLATTPPLGYDYIGKIITGRKDFLSTQTFPGS